MTEPRATPAGAASSELAAKTTASDTSKPTTNNGTTATGTASKSASTKPNGLAKRNNAQSRFKGANELLPILQTKTEASQKPEQFTTFLDALRSHIGSTYEESTDLDPLLKEPFHNPLPLLLRTLPTKNEVATQFGFESFALVSADAIDSITALFNEDMKLFSKRRRLIQNNTNKVFAVIWGQCSPGLRAELKGHTEFESKQTFRDASWLLQELKKSTAGLSRNTNIYVAMHTVMSALYQVKQRPDETLEQYHLRFKSAVETVKLSHGSIATHRCLIDHENDGDRVTETFDGDRALLSTDVLTIVEENYLAIAFLLGSDQHRYSGLITDLSNRCLTGTDDYPVDVPTAYAFLVKYKPATLRDITNDRNPRAPGRRNRNRNQNRGTGGSPNDQENVSVTMAQLQENPDAVPGNNGVIIPLAHCTHCNSKGHAKSYCPELVTMQGMQVHTVPDIHTAPAVLAQVEKKAKSLISDSWIILDSGSTISSICNPDLLSNVTTLEHPLKVYTNGGHQLYSQAGTLNVLPFEVYYNPESIANILSLSEVCDHFEVVLNSKNNQSIYVHVSKHQVLRFKRCDSGLYYIDLNANSEPITPYTFFTTVRANKEFFSPREIHSADKARQLQANLAWPSTADFKSYVKNNLLIDCDITVDDISRAEAIYGPQVPMLRGKMVRQTHNEFTTLQRLPLPTDIAKHHPTDEIDMDFFFVNGNPFFHTKSKVIKF